MSDLTDRLKDWIADHESPRLLMLSGAQGIGKSTAMRQVSETDPSILCLSLDDFYLSRDERLGLARAVHPLFETRGPPGTHDLPLLNATLDRLMLARPDDLIPLPVFSKRFDDRLPEQDWRVWRGKPSVVLLEGWLMGALADPAASASVPINEVEKCDPDGVWRDYQETCLSGDYARLWNRADSFCHLKAPSFETVTVWRTQQEADNLGVRLENLPADRIDWVRHFIRHYERITRRMLNGKCVSGREIRLDDQRHVIS